jgi:hypothetical protein
MVILEHNRRNRQLFLPFPLPAYLSVEKTASSSPTRSIRIPPILGIIFKNPNNFPLIVSRT